MTGLANCALMPSSYWQIAYRHYCSLAMLFASAKARDAAAFAIEKLTFRLVAAFVSLGMAAWTAASQACNRSFRGQSLSQLRQLNNTFCPSTVRRGSSSLGRTMARVTGQ